MKTKLENMTPTQRRKWIISMVNRRVKPGCGSSIELLKSRTWTQHTPDISKIIQKTPYVITGGIATKLYMAEINSSNLDIFVLHEDAKLINQELQNTSAYYLQDLDYGGTLWVLPDDTLLSVIYLNEPWAKDAIYNPNFSPHGLPVVKLPYLVLTKLRLSRFKDLADLSRMLGGASNLELDEVRKIIKLYYSEALEDMEEILWAGRLEYQE